MFCSSTWYHRKVLLNYFCIRCCWWAEKCLFSGGLWSLGLYSGHDALVITSECFDAAINTYIGFKQNFSSSNGVLCRTVCAAVMDINGVDKERWHIGCLSVFLLSLSFWQVTTELMSQMELKYCGSMRVPHIHACLCMKHQPPLEINPQSGLLVSAGKPEWSWASGCLWWIF